MSVEIKTKKIDAGFMMQLKGDVDITTSFVLKQNLDKMLKRGDTKALLINLSDVRYIDSVGVWVLAEASKKCMKQGMKLRLVEASAPVRELFSLVSLENLIEIYTSENEACEGL
jgi:anti-anti-sigma factor